MINFVAFYDLELRKVQISLELRYFFEYELWNFRNSDKE